MSFSGGLAAVVAAAIVSGVTETVVKKPVVAAVSRGWLKPTTGAKIVLSVMTVAAVVTAVYVKDHVDGDTE